MKKVILFAAVVSAISFTSCKKERDCTCTVTKSTPGLGTATYTEKTTYKDVTKSQGKNNCISWTKTDDNGAVTTEDCTLK
jgi:hypothetical protein